MTEHGARSAPGWPGHSPHWTSGAKTGVGTALSNSSRVWFTLGRAALTEIYFPDVDLACTRTLQFLITDRRDFFSAEETDTRAELCYEEAGVPAFHQVNTCTRGRFRLEKLILADPHRSAIMQQVRFVPREGSLGDYALFVYLQPHLGNHGRGNNAWLEDFKGLPLLFANRGGLALALACSAPWRKRSVGYVGASDGWEDIACHKEMRWEYQRAEDGNVALTGEIDLAGCDGQFLLVVGFGNDPGQAAHHSRASLLQGLEEARTAYVQGWQQTKQDLLPLPGAQKHAQDLYRISTALIRTHESKTFPGGIVASLAIPFGQIRGDGHLGYHLVWPRDMVQTVSSLLAVSKHADARRVLFYFWVTQDPDGHWPQNMHLDGNQFWKGTQLDETAFVILLVELARREKALEPREVEKLWPMVYQAARFLVRNGPVTPMDRWEEGPGYYASTLAVTIAALLAAADLAEVCQRQEIAAYLRETADAWNEAIDRLIYVTGTDLAHQIGVEGYYVRLALPDQLEHPDPAHGTVNLKNHPAGQREIAAADLVSPDALHLVRYGLRAPDDPRILNTIRVLDQTLKQQFPGGPCWHRYTKDGYGEHADGSPFDGTGVGRAWPLLTAERAHYELQAGRLEEAKRLLEAMESFASDSGLFPEQIWDAESLPEHNLFYGKPTGSACPLVWAHAEYLKLRRSLHEGKVFDQPEQAVRRYLVEKRTSPHVFWRLRQQCRYLPEGKVLRVEVGLPAVVSWSSDGGHTTHEVRTRDTELGLHLADLATSGLSAGDQVVFTFRWLEEGQEEGRDFEVQVTGPSPSEGRLVHSGSAAVR